MIRRITLIGWLAACCFGWVAGPSLLYGETIELQLRTVSDSKEPTELERMLQATSSQVFSCWMRDGKMYSANGKEEFDAQIKKEPTYQCSTPFKAVVKLGSHSYLLAFDSTDLKKQKFDRLYFDWNRNGDLTDDPIIEAVPADGDTRTRNFPRQERDIEVDGVHYKASVSLWVYSQVNSDGVIEYIQGVLTNHVYREGTLTLDGKSHQVFVLDFNNNGRFDDTAKLLEYDQFYVQSGDMILIDPALQKGSIMGYTPAYSADRQYLSKLLNIDGNYYKVKITPTGDRLTVEPAELPMGVLLNRNDDYRAVLFSDRRGCIRITGKKNQAVPVPAGKWQLVEYSVNSNEGAKASGVIGSATKEMKSVSLQEGRAETLTFGPPYRTVVTPQVYGGDSERDVIHLNLKFVGVGGDVVQGVFGDSERPEPTFKIFNKVGEIVQRGKFEYG